MVDKRETGGPAYPVVTDVSVIHRGMTLRDWFAGQALNGLRAANLGGEFEEDILARLAYKSAGAMIVERDKIENQKP